MALIFLPIVLIICFILLNYFLIRANHKVVKLKKILLQKEKQNQKQSEQVKKILTELNEVKEKQAQDVFYDSLTGLPGRQIFEDRLKQVLHQSKRNQLHFAVAFLNLDRFKMINNALDYDIGDLIIKEIANRLYKTIRTMDTVSRLNGDEFVFILSQLSKPETAVYAAQRLLEAVAEPLKINGHEIYITGSIGIAIYPSDGDDSKMLLKNAENAMHQAKARGRNSYEFYRPEMGSKSKRELTLIAGLRSPDVFEEFQLLYQPLINVENKKIVNMQVLPQWYHPDCGLIGPENLIQLVDHSQKSIELGEWILEKALRQFLIWKSSKLELGGIALSISLRQLENPRLAYKIKQLTQELNLDPVYLTLEISENFLSIKLSNELSMIEKMLNILKHIGVQIAVKDFGTGQLSLSHLKRLHMDSIKLAHSLIQDLPFNKENEMIAKMAVSLGKSLQIKVTAEGVETQKQKDMLNELGCYIMQGNFFTVPLKAEEFTLEKLNSLIVE